MYIISTISITTIIFIFIILFAIIAKYGFSVVPVLKL